MKRRVLIVEDHPAIAQNIADFLDEDRFELDFALDGLGGLHLALTQTYDVMVLDLGLPGMDGISVCRRLRQDAGLEIPILMLTARDTLADKIEGFRAGTDDFLVKPFALEELELRLEALALRGHRQHSADLVFGDLRLNPDRREARRSGVLLDLGPTPFRILLELLRQHPKVVSRAQLERAIWGEDPPQSDALRTHLTNLRRSLDRPDQSSYIETIYGVGFRLQDPHAASR